MGVLLFFEASACDSHLTRPQHWCAKPGACISYRGAQVEDEQGHRDGEDAIRKCGKSFQTLTGDAIVKGAHGWSLLVYSVHCSIPWVISVPLRPTSWLSVSGCKPILPGAWRPAFYCALASTLAAILLVPRVPSIPPQVRDLFARQVPERWRLQVFKLVQFLRGHQMGQRYPQEAYRLVLHEQMIKQGVERAHHGLCILNR